MLFTALIPGKEERTLTLRAFAQAIGGLFVVGLKEFLNHTAALIILGLLGSSRIRLTTTSGARNLNRYNTAKRASRVLTLHQTDIVNGTKTTRTSGVRTKLNNKGLEHMNVSLRLSDRPSIVARQLDSQSPGRWLRYSHYSLAHR
jgi:hypothetical protein